VIHSVHWMASLLRSLVGSSVFGLVISLSSSAMPERFHGYLLTASASVLFLALLFRSTQDHPLFQLLAVASGLTWGFLFAVSLVVSINNRRVSVHWPTMLPGLVLIPLGAFGVVFLPWLVARSLRNRIARRMTATASKGGG
jgi:hypothetical protein